MQIADLGDQWLIKRNKTTPISSVKRKKIKAKVKKEKAKVNSRDDKNYKRKQINSRERLALGNSQIGSFKDVLSNLLVCPSSNPISPLTYIPPTIANE